MGRKIIPDNLDVKKVRAALGKSGQPLTQTQLGALIPVSQWTISMWETGKRRPSRIMRQRMNDLLIQRSITDRRTLKRKDGK